MIEQTLEIGQLFKLLESYEKLKFTHNNEEFFKSNIEIKNEFNEYIKVTGGITKPGNGLEITFESGKIVKGEEKHLLYDKSTNNCIKLNKLKVGDTISNSIDKIDTIKNIVGINDTTFYDIEVQSDTHLYQTTNKFIHHNTEMAKLLSTNLDMHLIRFDMSEYQEKHTVSSLIGSPPGYVGYDEGSGSGKLISEVSKHPYSILLFDEVEKAHPDVINVFLQMLDEGKITSSGGKEVSLQNCIIIMTSNLGAQANEQNNIGFGQDLERTGEEDKAMKEFFKPELRNRIDATVKFKKLDTFSIKKIVAKFINELKTMLKGKKVRLTVNEDVIDYLAEIGYDSKMGARPIKRKIDDLLKIPLSKKILFEDLNNCKITAELVDDSVEFNVQDNKTKAPALDLVETNEDSTKS